MRLSLNNTTNDKILICDGSLYFTEYVINKINIDQSSIITEKTKQDNLEVCVNINEKNCIEHFSFGAATSWSEICYLHNFEIIESLRKILSNYDKSRFMFEALNELIQTRYNLYNISNDNTIYKINNLKVYNKLKEET